MKKKTLIESLLIMLAFYLVGSFAAMDFNPQNWIAPLRVVWSVICLLIVLVNAVEF